MESKLQFLRLLMLLMLSISALGTWAQPYNQLPTQAVCIGNQLYFVDPGLLPNPSYTWSITPGTPGIEWQINGTGTNITVDWKTQGVYVLSVYTTSVGCPGLAQTVTVTVTALPTATISYTGSPWCTVATAQTVTLVGTGAYTDGVYSSAVGLTIDPATGTITPSTSTVGDYTVTYTIAAGGCGVVTTTTSVTITAQPTASISYEGSPWCTDVANQIVTLTGTGAYTGGTYSSSTGLTIDPVSGAITPSTSTAGTYTVTYSGVAVAGCGVVTTTTSVTINAVPVTSPIYHN